jgi:hypothetical protein
MSGKCRENSSCALVKAGAVVSKIEKTILIELRGLRTDLWRKAMKEDQMVAIRDFFSANGISFEMAGNCGGEPRNNVMAVYGGREKKSPLAALTPYYDRHQQQVHWPREKAHTYKREEGLLGLFKKPLNIHAVPVWEGIDSRFIEQQKRRLLYAYAQTHRHWERYDRAATATLIKNLDRDYDFYHLTYFAIGANPRKGEDVIARSAFQFDLLDYYISEIVRALAERELEDKTLVILFASQAQTRFQGYLDLAATLQSIGQNKIAVNRPPNANDAGLCLQNGTALAGIYWRNGKHWKKEVSYPGADSDKHKLASALCKRNEVDLVLLRLRNNAARIFSQWGSSELTWQNQELRYQVINGKDPLFINQRRQSWTAKESFDQTRRNRYPDALWQIWQLFAEAKAADMYVSARRGHVFAAEKPLSAVTIGSLQADNLMLLVFINQRFKSRIRRANDLLRYVQMALGLIDTAKPQTPRAKSGSAKVANTNLKSPASSSLQRRNKQRRRRRPN